MKPAKPISNSYRNIIQQAMASDSRNEPLSEIRERHEQRKKLLLESLGKVRKEILKALKELKKQMPGLAVSENVPRRDYHAVEYNFISAKGEFCKAELYLWSNRKGGILNLSGPAGSTKTYAYGQIGEIRLEGNSKPPLEYKDPAAAIAAYVATTLGKSLKMSGPAG